MFAMNFRTPLGKQKQTNKQKKTTAYDRPFPVSPKPRLRSEAKHEATDVKMIIYSQANKTQFQKKKV